MKKGYNCTRVLDTHVPNKLENKKTPQKEGKIFVIIFFRPKKLFHLDPERQFPDILRKIKSFITEGGWEGERDERVCAIKESLKERWKASTTRQLVWKVEQNSRLLIKKALAERCQISGDSQIWTRRIAILRARAGGPGDVDKWMHFEAWASVRLVLACAWNSGNHYLLKTFERYAIQPPPPPSDSRCPFVDPTLRELWRGSGDTDLPW